MHVFWLLLAFLPVGRPVATTHALGQVGQTVVRTSYDSTGRVAWSVDPAGVTNALGYDALNRRVQMILPNVLASGPRTTNAVGKNNRLTSSSAGGFSAVYDLDGNRTRKTAGGVTTHFLVATENPTGWPPVVEEHTGTNPGTLIRRYTYGADLISQSRWTGSVWDTHFFLTDGLGSTRALLNSSGGISDTYTYDAFGNLLTAASAGTTPNHYRYTGEQWDNELGMYYLRARYMSPAMGRFWSRDTFEGHPTDPLSLHRYLYAHADPVNGTDPSGHMTLTEVNVTMGQIANLSRMSLRVVGMP